MNRLSWRVLLVIFVVPLGLPWGLCTFCQIVVSVTAWLAFGPDEDRTARIIQAAPAGWFAAPLDYLAGKAAA